MGPNIYKILRRCFVMFPVAFSPSDGGISWDGVLPPSISGRMRDDDIKNVVSLTVLTGSFYLSQVVLQRCMGMLRIHGGRHGLITSTFGCALTVSSLLIAHEAEKFARSQFFQGKVDNFFGNWSFGRSPSEQRHNLKKTIQSLFVGIGVFALLEQGMFRTAFPSSVITLGVFANTGNMLRRSIEATSAIATESQRLKIQTLGKRYGCHQCGSSQWFSKRGFIADHMPPTKQALEMSQAWWRRVLKIEVKQRLWPQCQKCFQLQGTAVRTWTHTLVYHNSLKLYHSSPAIAFLLLQHPVVIEYVDHIVEPTVCMLEKVKRSEFWKFVTRGI